MAPSIAGLAIAPGRAPPPPASPAWAWREVQLRKPWACTPCAATSGQPARSTAGATALRNPPETFAATFHQAEACGRSEGVS